MTEQALLRTRRRRRKPVLVLCLASPVVLCLGWVALWLFAQREAANAMDGWFASEAGRGRQWTCPDRQIGGFPFDLRVSCTDPTLKGNLGGALVDVTAAGLDVVTHIYQPNAVEAALTSPIKIQKTNRETPSVVTFSSLVMQARLLVDGRVRLALTAEEPALEEDGTVGKATLADLRVAPAAGSAASDKSYDVLFKVEGASAPVLDAVLGDTEPVSIDETGVLTAVDPKGVAPWPVLAEGWRQAGGVFDLTTLTLAKGAFKAQAQGRLALDDAHRVSGRLQTALSGYETLAARFGISPDALSVGTALAKLLGRGAPAGDRQAIKLPVSFVDGRMAVGPILTSVRLAPLY